MRSNLTVPTDQPGDEKEALIAAEASQFRAVLLGENRSVILTQLFDYLLERSADRRAPKEIEIAMAVFGKSAAFDTSQDSMVRGHMSRLRQRLDHFNTGKSGPRLQIPKGEYRLILAPGPEDTEEEEAVPPPEPPPARSAAWRRLAVMFAASVLGWAAFFLFEQLDRGPSPLWQTAFWRPVAVHKRLPVIAVGDFYVVVESGPDGKPRRLIMNPLIQSGRDLDNYLTLHPDDFSKLHDRDIHRVPARVATGAAAILPLISAMRADHGIPDITPVSQLSQDAIDSGNVIFIDYFAQLGTPRSPILQMSGFVPSQNFDEMRDIASGKVFTARSESAQNSDATHPAAPAYGYDYGYVASYPGPSGNQILVISGIEDAGLSRMVKLVSDKRELDLLARQTHGAAAFEALYQVRTVGGLIFDTSLLIARPLKTEGQGPPVVRARNHYLPMFPKSGRN
ncbi:hypothetical protein [Nitrospirillum viridazoti]|uniref:Uncharacterized protein n=1 Tax=Nitrospirillum viridazoti CBAmc TaxID=1441467 RepID=A0A248JU92_9PROT|nr:hypothetical protein [Nitrospirillum amazonense]ASG22293.1 hypothetical protein Y958_15130 [Nitrospirillum amazonense CBAmc]TWB43185.1 hypothetical protein FBZ91_102402 [Nitrospirillum amazonense]